MARTPRSWLLWPLLFVALACTKDEPRASGVPQTGGGGAAGPRAAPPAYGVGSGGTDDAGSGGSGGSEAPTPEDAGTPDGTDAGAPTVRLPPANVGFDYQLGGAYAPNETVEIVTRDRNASVARGLYNICYVNGFQVQPDEEAFWLDEHPDLVLRDASGEPVIDEDWDEMLIDVSTESKRAAVAEIVGEWIAGCAADGFDAVEIDNLDSFSRSGGLLIEDHAVAAMALFSETAHEHGLAIAQKNSAELVGRRTELGTDFAVAEECNRYAECGVYVAGYDDLVFVIEYRPGDFADGCAGFPDLSIILRDVELTTPANEAYVYDGC